MQNETLRIMCPKLTCKKILVVPASSRGKNVRCKNCGSTIRVPDRPPPAPPPENAAPPAPAANGTATPTP